MKNPFAFDHRIGALLAAFGWVLAMIYSSLCFYFWRAYGLDEFRLAARFWGEIAVGWAGVATIRYFLTLDRTRSRR